MNNSSPIIIEGPEQSQLDPTLPDGALPPAVGVHSYQVFRASRDTPELTDGKGWTYHHHVDMACWRGRLYVGWNSCERDEDVWPSRELLSTSVDGRSWTAPVELFPQGVSTPLRMYFFHAPNGRMLAIAGLRVGTDDTSEDRKGPLIVREIHPDQTLGDVYTLQGPEAIQHRPPMFEACADRGFVDGCRELLEDRVFLEQQDRGKLLGRRRMKWHDAAAWPEGSVPGDSEKWVAGKSYSFFRRPDGVLVGVSKMGWTTQSSDDGQTWSQPVVPPTLVTGKAKVWGQRTRDGRYALVYNPSRRNRFPLAIVTGDDGVRFGNMRIVQGEMPVQRYAGLHRSIGPQYVRGISHWADDGSRSDEQAMWLAYSMNKEDIWVSRVPLPVQSATRLSSPFGPEPLNGSKSGTTSTESLWNVYSPRWAPVTVAGDELRLEDRDPYDYACATRVFPEMRDATVSFEVLADQPGAMLEVEVSDAPLSQPVRVRLEPGPVGAWQLRSIQVAAVQRVTFRTGPYRGVGGAHPVAAETDRPIERVAFKVRRVQVIARERRSSSDLSNRPSLTDPTR